MRKMEKMEERVEFLEGEVKRLNAEGKEKDKKMQELLERVVVQEEDYQDLVKDVRKLEDGFESEVDEVSEAGVVDEPEVEEASTQVEREAAIVGAEPEGQPEVVGGADVSK